MIVVGQRARAAVDLGTVDPDADNRLDAILRVYSLHVASLDWSFDVLRSYAVAETRSEPLRTVERGWLSRDAA